MSDIFSWLIWLISIITTSRKRVIPGLPTPILKYDLISTAGYVAALVWSGGDLIMTGTWPGTMMHGQLH